MTLKRNMNDPASRAYWEFLDRIEEEVMKSPPQLRGESERERRRLQLEAEAIRREEEERQQGLQR